eukprot:4807390-Lingulodinium_polyedra.AAC.1
MPRPGAASAPQLPWPPRPLPWPTPSSPPHHRHRPLPSSHQPSPASRLRWPRGTSLRSAPAPASGPTGDALPPS